MVAAPDPYDFSGLLAMGRSELREAYCETVSELATTHERVAYMKITGTPSDRYEYEGIREALTEKKWLILKLMEDVE